MAKHSSPFHGLLIVDKPGRFDEERNRHGDLLTSHDVVQQVRRWSGQRRIGHTGTLDPMASGVLVLCLGQATRLVEYYQGHNKTYRAEVVLGRATDSHDALGKTIAASPVPTLDTEQIEQALEQFRGSIQQIPPIFSAIKRDGESAHRKARRGEHVDLPPRPVTIHTLTLLDFLPQPEPRLHLHIECSAGTYIRSLARDLGIALGTHGFLDALCREQAGAFTLADAQTLPTIEQAASGNRLDRLLLPPSRGLSFPTITVDAEAARRLGQGQRVELSPLALDSALDTAPAEKTLLAQAMDKNGAFLGIARKLDGNLWKAEKWFHQ